MEMCLVNELTLTILRLNSKEVSVLDFKGEEAWHGIVDVIQSVYSRCIEWFRSRGTEINLSFKPSIIQIAFVSTQQILLLH